VNTTMMTSYSLFTNGLICIYPFAFWATYSPKLTTSNLAIRFTGDHCDGGV
jgi:hypothetical protein